jgi:YVTN family beta-propeller protein
MGTLAINRGKFRYARGAMIGAAEGETSMTRFGVCLSVARRRPRGRLAAAGAIGALTLALAAPTAASAAPKAPAVTGTITVGGGPAWVAVNPVTGAVYVTNSISGTVSVISGRTNAVTATITATITVGTGAVGVVVNPVTGAVYVANFVSGTVSVISGRTNAVTATITVGTGPNGVAVNPVTGAVYVANFVSDNVSVISGCRFDLRLTPRRRSADPAALGPERVVRPGSSLRQSTGVERVST